MQLDAGARSHPRSRAAIDGSRGVHVVSSEHQRTGVLVDLRQAATGTMVPLALRHLEPLGVVDRIAKLGIRLHDDLPGAAESVEIIDIETSRGRSGACRTGPATGPLSPCIPCGRPQRRLRDVGPKDRGKPDERRLLNPFFLRPLGGLRTILASVSSGDSFSASTLRFFAWSTRFSVCPCRVRDPRSPRSSTMSLKPPARPTPHAEAGRARS